MKITRYTVACKGMLVNGLRVLARTLRPRIFCLCKTTCYAAFYSERTQKREHTTNY